MQLALCVLLLYLMLPFRAVGQGTTMLEGGARSVGLGGTGAALTEDVWARGNPASWGTLAARSVSFFTAQHFGLREMRVAEMVYAEPTSLATVALGARTFGYEAYRESDFVVGIGRSVRMSTTRRFYVGLRVRYHHLTIPGYGDNGAVSLSAGGMTALLPSLDFGFRATNLNRSAVAGAPPLPRTLSIGLAFAPSPGLQLLVDAVKDIQFPLAFRAGIEVEPIPELQLRSGITTQPTRFTAGIGILLDRFTADVAAQRHYLLGWSPAVSAGMQW